MMIFGNLQGDQAGYLFWAEKAIHAHGYASFIRWPIGHGRWQDLRALNQEVTFLYIIFTIMGWVTGPISTPITHAMNTLAGAYLLNLLLSIVSVYLLARLYAPRWVSWVCALVTCLSLSWFERSSGHFNLTAFYALFSLLYLA